MQGFRKETNSLQPCSAQLVYPPPLHLLISRKETVSRCRSFSLVTNILFPRGRTRPTARGGTAWPSPTCPLRQSPLRGYRLAQLPRSAGHQPSSLGAPDEVKRPRPRAGGAGAAGRQRSPGAPAPPPAAPMGELLRLLAPRPSLGFSMCPPLRPKGCQPQRRAMKCATRTRTSGSAPPPPVPAFLLPSRVTSAENFPLTPTPARTHALIPFPSQVIEWNSQRSLTSA